MKLKNLKLAGLSLALVTGLAGCGNQEPVLVDIQVDNSECVLNFAKDATFTDEGLKVIAVYSDGSTQELEYVTSSPDMSTTGDKEVTVTYTVDGEEQTFVYNVNVSYWNEDAQDIMDKCTLISFNDIEIPYVPGMTMEKTEDFEMLVTLPNATKEFVYDYADAFDELDSEFNYMGRVFEFNLDRCTDSMAAAYANVNNDDTLAVFRLVPADADENRLFIYDQYYVIGLDAENNMIIKTRTVSNFGLDGVGIFPIYLEDEYVTSFGFQSNAIYNYYVRDFFVNSKGALAKEFESECVAVLPLPECTSTTDMYFGYEDIILSYPFATSLDEYDLAINLVFEFDEATRTKFINDLLYEGFEFSEILETNGFVEYEYILENDFQGTYIVDVSTIDQYGEFSVAVYFKHPKYIDITKSVFISYSAFYERLGIDVEELMIRSGAVYGYGDVELVATADPLSVLCAELAFVVDGKEVTYLTKPVLNEEKGYAQATLLYKGYDVTVMCMIAQDRDTGALYGYFGVMSQIHIDHEMTLEEFVDSLSPIAVMFGEEFELDQYGYYSFSIPQIYQRADVPFGNADYFAGEIFSMMPSNVEQLFTPFTYPVVYDPDLGMNSLIYGYISSDSKYVVLLTCVFYGDANIDEQYGLTQPLGAYIEIMTYEQFIEYDGTDFTDPVDVASCISYKLSGGITNLVKYSAANQAYMIGGFIGDYFDTEDELFDEDNINNVAAAAEAYLPYCAEYDGTYDGGSIIQHYYYVGTVEVMIQIKLTFDEQIGYYYQVLFVVFE